MKPTLHNDLSENAVLLIKTTHRDHARTMAGTASADQPYFSHTRLGTHTPASGQRQSCVLRMITVVEVYVDLVLETALRKVTSPTVMPPSKPAQPPAPATGPLSEVTDALLDLAMPTLDSWAGRNTFAKMFRLPAPSTFGQWEQVLATTYARNSIAHGLGALTRKQDDDTKRVLRKIKIAVTDGHTVLTDDALTHIRDLLVAFIEHFDAAYGRLPL